MAIFSSLARATLREFAAQLPAPTESENEFSTEVFLGSVLAAENLTDNDVQILDRLCKKIDVVKKLRTFYTLDLSRAGKGSSNLPPGYLILAIGIMLIAARERDDLKFLNTALNGLDLITSESETNASPLRIWANELLTEMV